MELAGDEKRIQALFRELSLEDTRVATEFVRLWNRAQVSSQKPRRTFRTSFAVIAALLAITLCAVALWSRNWRDSQPQFSAVARGSTIPGPEPASAPASVEPNRLVLDASRDLIRFNRRPWKPATRRQAVLTPRNAVIPKAIAISRWQSPTVKLMQSPAEDVLTLLPQLNRSVSELKSFLPRTEVKEIQ